eukprot:3778347-Pleurochrysis_carterae.AAC.3
MLYSKQVVDVSSCDSGASEGRSLVHGDENGNGAPVLTGGIAAMFLDAGACAYRICVPVVEANLKLILQSLVVWICMILTVSLIRI